MSQFYEDDCPRCGGIMLVDKTDTSPNNLCFDCLDEGYREDYLLDDDDLEFMKEKDATGV